jgi:hypothetical protein
LLLVLRLYRNKIFISGFAALSAFVLLTAVGFASSKSAQGITYKTSLGVDLDGDHIPETAVVRQRGSFYQVSIHFSTGRPKLRLRTYVGDDVAGLVLEVADVNSDSEADVVITSATSIWPVAVWLNRGGTKFHRVAGRAFALAGGYNGPRLQQKPSNRPDAVGGLSNDRLQAEFGTSFSPYTRSQDFVPVQAPELRFKPGPTQVAPRGPPSAEHI